MNSQDIERIAVSGIEANFEKDKSITPICILLDKDNKLAIFPTIVNSIEEKNNLVDVIIPSAIKQTGASVLALISEAWMSKPDVTKDTLNAQLLKEGLIRPSEDPNRQEVIMLTIETIASTKMLMWNIIRDEGIPARIERIEQDDNTDVSGRYANLLTQVKPSQN